MVRLAFFSFGVLACAAYTHRNAIHRELVWARRDIAALGRQIERHATRR